MIHRNRCPSPIPTPCPRRCQTGLRPFLDQAALELGQAGEYVKDKFAAGRGGVDSVIADRLETDPTLAEVFDQIDQVPQAAAQPVEPPNRQVVAGVGGPVRMSRRDWSSLPDRCRRFHLCWPTCATHLLLSGQLGSNPTPMVSFLDDSGDRGVRPI